MKSIKIVLLLLLICMTFCSCKTNANTDAVETTTNEYEYEQAKVANVKTDCGLIYASFLKLGSLTNDEVSAELPEFTYTYTDGDTWELNNSDSDMATYKRVIDAEAGTMTSTYTKTFPVNVDDINAWVDIEVQGLDELFSITGERISEEGVTWYYHWASSFEDCKLQVYSTGVTGEYIGLISFTRSGETSIEDDFVIDARETEAE